MRNWMKRSLILLAVLGLFAASAGAATPVGPGGSLVIVGGALASGNGDVYKAFVDRAGTGKIGIIPAASGKPVKYARQFIDDLKAYGVDPSRAEIIPLAVRNDKTTKDVDESKWADRGDDPAVASRILSCSAVWFLGGDQTRITKVLLH